MRRSLHIVGVQCCTLACAGTDAQSFCVRFCDFICNAAIGCFLDSSGVSALLQEYVTRVCHTFFPLLNMGQERQGEEEKVGANAIGGAVCLQS